MSGRPPASPAPTLAPSTFERAAPILFVLIWSTGWIAAGAAAPHADPLTFLTVRFGGALALVGGFALVMRAPRLGGAREVGHAMVSGVLLHAAYLGGVWWAIAHGVPAGVSGIIAGLQPVLTAALAPVLVGERLGRAAWVGVVLGFLGVALVIAPKLGGVEAGALAAAWVPLGINLAAMLSVVLGTFYQKRFVALGDLRTVAAWQYAGALLALAPVALATEELRFDINATTLAVLAWSILVLSIGGIALLLILLRRGAVTRAAAFIYLVPAVTALQAWAFLGETLSPVQMLGAALTVGGVALAARAV